MGIRCTDHVAPLYPQKLALTSPTSGGRSVGIVRSRTKATESYCESPPNSDEWLKCKSAKILSELLGTNNWTSSVTIITTNTFATITNTRMIAVCITDSDIIVQWTYIIIIIIIIVVIIIYLSWSWVTFWLVSVSRIQKCLQRSAMIPSASWAIAFHYPG